MANFTRTDMGMGVLTPGGIAWRDDNGQFEFPASSGNDHGESLLAELDAIKDDIADHIGLSTQLYRDRRMPEGVGIWVAMHLTSTSGPNNIPDDQTMWGLKHRGVVPVFQIDAPGPRMSGPLGAGNEGKYVGAPVTTGTRSTPVGNIPNWSNTHADRNWAQRVLDGDYDGWIDAFAGRIADYVGLVDPSTGNPNPSANLKGESYSDYDAVIVRPWFEMNGRALNQSLPWVDDPAGSRSRGIQEANAAWCHLVDRVRTTNGATNASFFWCFAYTGQDLFRRDPTNYLPELNGGGTGTDAALRSRIHFLGVDSYDGNGSGIDGNLVLDAGGTYDPGDHYLAIFEDFGDTAKPMLVGEWGTCLGHQDNVEGSPPVRAVPDRKWNCTEEATTFSNEKCRGRWIKESADDIVDKRAGSQGDTNKWEALKGLFYMARDLAVKDVWGLWKDTATNYGSTAGPGGWSEPDPEPRPALGAGIPGSGEYAFARYADLFNDTPYGSEFRGRAGAFWDV